MAMPESVWKTGQVLALLAVTSPIAFHNFPHEMTEEAPHLHGERAR